MNQIIVRTEWAYSTESITHTMLLAGWQVVKVYRGTGLWADLTLASGGRIRVHDGQDVSNAKNVRIIA